MLGARHQEPGRRPRPVLFQPTPTPTFWPTSSPGASTPSASSNCPRRPCKRQVFVNTWDLYAADNWKIKPNLSINYGFSATTMKARRILNIQTCPSSDPSEPTGLAVAGVNVANIYNQFYGAFSPRVGFAYSTSLENNGKIVIRGGYGLYYDSIYMKSVLQNTMAPRTSRSSALGLNPAGFGTSSR